MNLPFFANVTWSFAPIIIKSFTYLQLPLCPFPGLRKIRSHHSGPPLACEKCCLCMYDAPRGWGVTAVLFYVAVFLRSIPERCWEK